MSRRGCAVLAALLVMAAVPAQTAVPTARHAVEVGSRAVSASVRDGVVTPQGPQAWPLGAGAADGAITPEDIRISAAASLVRLGAPDAVFRQELTQSHSDDTAAEYESVVGAGDLDGDGGDDLLAYRWRSDYDSESLTLRAVRGVDGAELWSLETDSIFAHAVPAVVNDAGAAGVMLVEYDVSWQGAILVGTTSVPVTISALAGADGAAAWTRTFEGRVYEAGVAAMAQDLVGTVSALDAVGGAATDLLVNVLDGTATPVSVETTVTAEVLDGATGETATSASRTVDDYAEPVALPTGDLDAVAGDDFMFVTLRWDDAHPWRPRSDLHAHRGTTGEMLWEQTETDVDPYSLVTDAGDLSGDGHAELLVSSWRGRTVLLDGADGHQRWRRRAEQAYPVGDVDGDGAGDVALARHSYGDVYAFAIVIFDTAEASPVGAVSDPATPTAGSATLRAQADESATPTESAVVFAGFEPPRDDVVGYVLRVVDADGTRLRTSRATVPLPRTEYASSLYFEPAGDVDGDGRIDAMAMSVVADMERETVQSRRRMISGATGATLWSPRLATSPVGGSIDAEGADVVHVRPTRQGLRITAHDGRDGSALWSTRVLGAPRWGGYDAVDVNGDGHADVVVTSAHGVVAVLDGTSGATLWGAVAGGMAIPIEAEPSPLG